jgi:hypothetical protein
MSGKDDHAKGELFGFEQDFVESLRCIPMAVRYRLDITGVKLRLNEWSKLGQADRRTLLESACATPEEIAAYRDALSVMVVQACGNAPSLLPEVPEPLWDSPTVPGQVGAKAAEVGADLSDAAWSSLTALQRFALVKLSRPGHENRNFLPALAEFGIQPR